jgi:hypothetical protein
MDSFKKKIATTKNFIPDFSGSDVSRYKSTFEYALVSGKLFANHEDVTAA